MGESVCLNVRESWRKFTTIPLDRRGGERKRSMIIRELSQGRRLGKKTHLLTRYELSTPKKDQPSPFRGGGEGGRGGGPIFK